jgi:hypothetical protein
MKSLMIILTALILVSEVKANQADLIVSIDKEGVAQADIPLAIDALNKHDPTLGTCFVESKVVQYIDFTQSSYPKDLPYYGIVIVTLSWECEKPARDYLTELDRSSKYTLYSNPGIGPWPAVSGSN